LIFLLLLTLAFAASTSLQPRAVAWTSGRGSDHLLHVLLGDGRELLANHLFVKADVYFHSGYYPSIFDLAHAPTNSQHMMAAATGTPNADQHTQDQHDEEEHEKAMSFLQEPRDWIERFGRHFMITSHSHLSGGKEREILPWLRLSADLDPHRIETYTVAAYWLRVNLHKSIEAEQFLREGLRANPDSYELLFELGSLYYEDAHDVVRARNLWEIAYQRWNRREAMKEKPDLFGSSQITMRLANLERDQGHYGKAIEWLEIAKSASPDPQAIQTQIDRLRAR
jgi:tetratricopeptide (TPR) repeat protein